MNSKVAKALSRLLFQTEEREIQIVAKKAIPKINLGEESIGPFNEGDLASLPAWQAIHLVKSGLATFKNGETVSLAELYNYLWKEERQASLQPLPDDFFLRLKLSMNILPETEKGKVSLALNDLLCRRLEKIVKAALRARQSVKATENMLPEEKILHAEIASNITEWLNVLHKFLSIP